MADFGSLASRGTILTFMKLLYYFRLQIYAACIVHKNPVGFETDTCLTPLKVGHKSAVSHNCGYYSGRTPAPADTFHH